MKILKRIRKKFLLRLFVVLAVVGVLWLYCEKMACKLILPIAKSQIEHFTGSEVAIGSVDVGLDGIIRMKGVVVSSCIDETGLCPLLVADSIEAQFPLFSILTFRPKLRSLTVDDFVLDVRYNRDLSTWNMMLMEGAGGKSKKSIPSLQLNNGVVQLSKMSGGKTEKLFSVGVKKGAVADIEKKNAFGFEFEINPSSSGLSGKIGGKLEKSKKGESGRLIITSEEFSTGSEAIFGNVWNVRNMRLDMDYDENDLKVNTLVWEMGDNCKFSMSGEVKDYQHDCDYSGHVRVENMFVSDMAKTDSLVYYEGLSDNIGEGLRKFLEIYKPKGVCDFDFKAEGRFGELLKSKWSGTVSCKDLSIMHKKFPYQLEHMTGDVILDVESIGFSELTCMHDDVVYEITGGTKTVDGLKVTDIVIASDNVLLGNDIYRALSKKQQDIWYTFTPRGRAKVKYFYHRKHDKLKGASFLEIDMIGGEADYLHFPYHLENITGRVTISPDRVELLNLVSGTKESSISLNGEVTAISSKRPQYDININANNIPLDSRLKAALPYSQRSFYDSFKLTARTDVEIHIFPNHVGTRPVEYIAKVSIKDALMMYEDFPLPLTDVNVDATLTPAGTFLDRVTGRNGDGTVDISGTVWPADENHSEAGYCIELTAKNIQVQDRWLKSLPADSYKVLSQLRPEGAINVVANLSHKPRIECSDFKIVVESLGGRVNYTKFPYPIDNIYGKVTIEKEKISLENISGLGHVVKGDNGDYTKSVALNGVIELGDEKFKVGRFSVLAENIVCNEKMKNALVGISGGLYTSLKPCGRFDLAINDLTYHNDGDKRGVVEFQSELTLKDFDLKDGSLIGGVNGTFDSTVVYKVGEGLLEGKGYFDVDSMKIKGRVAENVYGEIIYDPNDGSFMSKEYTARCYGGKVLGSLSFTRGENKKMDYALETIFSEVDLHGLVSAGAGDGEDDDYTKGQVGGYLAVTGEFGDDSTRVGRLNMEISEMQFAERSLLGKIVSASQMQEPTDYIFSDVNIESYLQKDTLFLENVEVFGKSMRMKGAGKVNITKGNIEMVFSASGKPTKSKPSFLETFVRSIGPAVVEVDVAGTFDKPEIKTTTLPAFQKPFGIFGSKEKE